MGTAQTWNGSYEEDPTAGSSPANGDNEIRNLKTTIRGINNKEHWHGIETGVDDLNLVGKQGLHRRGSAIPFIQEATPSARPGGEAFEYDYDRGRLWIDLSDNAKMKYLYYEDSDATPEWRPVINYSIGEIASFAFPPPVNERWLPCDGQTITKSDTSLDGVVGGYENLIDELVTEAGGDTDHPYYVQVDGNAAKIPDLRGVSLRGLASFAGGGSLLGSRLDPDDDTQGIDHDGARDAGGYQRDKIFNHFHQAGHTHGKVVVSGYDSGAGRTGIITGWSSGSPTFDDDTGESLNWEADSSWLTADGILTMTNPNDPVGGGSGGGVANDSRVTVDLEHYHTIPRYNGLTEDIEGTNTALAAITAGEYGLPSGADAYPHAVEATVKNTAVYYFIRY